MRNIAQSAAVRKAETMAASGKRQKVKGQKRILKGKTQKAKKVKSDPSMLAMVFRAPMAVAEIMETDHYVSRSHL